MLTGDGINAAVSVAIKTGVIGKRQAKKGICVIDVVRGALRWKKMTPLSFKKPQILSKKTSTWNSFSQESTIDTIRNRLGVIVATGTAIELLISECEENKDMKSNLNQLSVIACASPKTKQKIIQAFKQHCGRRVLMCGKWIT
jgi:magnesium-transporting ATPase (P-type)